MKPDLELYRPIEKEKLFGSKKSERLQDLLTGKTLLDLAVNIDLAVNTLVVFVRKLHLARTQSRRPPIIDL